MTLKYSKSKIIESKEIKNTEVRKAMFSLKSYLPDATLSKYVKVLVHANENIFVKISLGKEQLIERFLREDEILDAVVELNEGRNDLQIEGENLDGCKYVMNKSIRYLEKPFAIVDQNYAGCDKDVAGGILVRDARLLP
mgnify:CR=1 FL=1